MQYSISNLNAFIILISIGFSLYYYINDSDEFKQLAEKNNSPIQLISQMKGYFYLNPVLALSLSITIFSFVGIPPLIGFFAKQMVLSAALDSGYIFLALVAILTSVISAVYYLNIIKQVFFDESEYKINPEVEKQILHGNIIKKNILILRLTFKVNNIILSSYLTITISILTLMILLFMFSPQILISLVTIVAIILFNH
jgi:NADH-ubiquinone oxidoreductase chain 2